MTNSQNYTLLDCGNGRKLEQLGNIVVDRSAPSASHKASLPTAKWQQAHAKHFKAQSPQESHRWEIRDPAVSIGNSWPLSIGPLVMNCKLTEFGHIGFFPEQASEWPWLIDQAANLAKKFKRSPKILNLFGHTGGSSLALAMGGAHVTHVDSSKSAVIQGRDNQILNPSVPENSIRWIHEDCQTFLEKEIRRGNAYDGVVLDPPSYGKGIKKGQSFKIEQDLESLILTLKELTQAQGLSLLHFSCHTLEFNNTRVAEICQKSFKLNLSQLEEKSLNVKSLSNSPPLASGICVRYSVE